MGGSREERYSGGCTAEVEGCGAGSRPGIWRGGGRGGVAVGKVAVGAIGLVVRIFEVCHYRFMVIKVEEGGEW